MEVFREGISMYRARAKKTLIFGMFQIRPDQELIELGHGSSTLRNSCAIYETIGHSLITTWASLYLQRTLNPKH